MAISISGESIGASRRRVFAWHGTTWLALVVGIVFAALSLSPDYVAGTGPYWQAPVGDAAQGQIGWFYYARDIWRFPLFATATYHLPEGASLLLSDGLPLFALPAKLLYQLAWPMGAVPPVYVGLWVALCLVLQAVAASRLLRALGVIHPVQHLAGLALFCYAPVLFLRFGHASLMGQFLILLALEGYVRAKRDGLTRRGWGALCALPVLALLVHPYLAAMCGVLVAATILDQWRERRLDARGVVLRFASIAIAALAVIYVGGFASGAQDDFGDYGLYSLNLLSPWIPFPQTLSGRWLGSQMPVLPGTHQEEGGAWLGAGVLLLCVLALPTLRDWRAKLHRHAVLLALLAALLVFAVSQRVGFGAHELVRVPLPDAVLHALSQFRGSGRFVWVPLYALLGALVVAVVHHHGTCRATLVLAVAALLQVADVRPMQAGVRQATANGAAATIDRAAWTRLIAAHQRIFQFPSFECGGLFGKDVPGTKFRELEIDWIAAELAKPTNSAYLARFSKDCAREREDAVRGHGQAGVLYLYRSTDETGLFLERRGVDASHCGYLDDVVVCSADMDLSALR